MAQILISATSAEDWKRFLADPGKQWRRGYSAPTRTTMPSRLWAKPKMSNSTACGSEARPDTWKPRQSNVAAITSNRTLRSRVAVAASRTFGHMAQSYCQMMVTVSSGGAFGFLTSILERDALSWPPIGRA